MLKRFFGRSPATPSRTFITVVSGLPRSGTSMMMKMLDAGGIPPIIDNIRTADEDNPKGYYEFERVKALDKGDTAWVADAVGKSVKVISALLRHLPGGFEYRVVFMRRRLEESIESQKKMLVRRGEDPDKISDAEVLTLLQKHLDMVDNWLGRQPNIRCLDVQYHEMIANPIDGVARLNAFLGGDLNAQAMAQVVDENLYRNRA
ncbi:MAG: sulfotransferase [Phycisphaerales bacterium]|nr:sulfotransferase [Phycisphaerales bacterium]